MGIRIRNKDEYDTYDIEDLQPNQLGHHEKRSILTDSYGRIARKLRISLTDRCNMRCMYCMPKGKVQWFNEEDILNYDEITRLVSILVDLGIERIRLTGGEPLLRPKLEDLICSLSKINSIKSVSMTTNGLLLGFKIKINMVVVRGWNDDEIVDFANFARDTGHTVRFIEFMPLDGSGIWQPNLVFSKREMIKVITDKIMEISPLKHFHNNSDNNTNSTDPAMLYSFADGKGTIGFIPSITEPFCGNCDRMRLTSDGRLLTCLFENPGYDLASMLRSGKSEYYIKEHIIASVKKKPEGIIRIIKTNSLKPSLNL